MNASAVKIEISDRKKILSIQKEFSNVFPYLKLEFFTKSHYPGGGTPKKFMISNDHTIGNCRTIHKTGKITIKPSMPVAQLENDFKSIYGLNVQVFRLSGRVWLETTLTDSWTLEEQDKQGKALTKV